MPATIHGVVVPHTGEILPALADLSAEQLAEQFDAAKAMEGRLSDFRSMLGEELIRRLDHRCDWTLHEGPFDIEAPSNAPVLTVDVEPFRAELQKLVVEGAIDAAAATAAIRRKTTYAAAISGVRALLKNPVLAERLAGVCREVPVSPGSRRVTVKRRKPTTKEH